MTLPDLRSDETKYWDEYVAKARTAERNKHLAMFRIILPALEAMAEGKSCQIVAGDLARQVRRILA